MGGGLGQRARRRTTESFTTNDEGEESRKQGGSGPGASERASKAKIEMCPVDLVTAYHFQTLQK